jgi:ferric-dicitrate binding protein FerR (iron transport regulator)
MSTVATASHTFSTPRGQRARLNLPDGTRVLLGPDSRLEVSLDFGAVVREVRLDGLAYFEVAKDSTRPFRVLGGEGTVQVLGTHFSARADSGAAGPLEVVVAEGRVALSSSSARQVLTRGDRGRLSADGTVGVAHGVDLDRSLGWIEGRLDYDNAPLSVVLGDLERWYDVQFVVADSALRRAHLSTTLRDDSLIETLRLLETALGATALVRDKTVVLRLAHQTR